MPNPIVPTPPAGDSSNRIADTAFVQRAVASAGGVLNPLIIGTSLYPSIVGTSGGFRYNPTSSLLANAIGARQIMAGLPAVDSATTWMNNYLGGVDANGAVALYGNSPVGTFGVVAGTRSSDNVQATPQNIIAEATVSQHDHTSIGHLVWCRYDAGIIGSTSVPSHFIGYEIDLHNLTTASPTQDPFNINPTGSAETLRLASGIPGLGDSPNDIGTYLVITNNAKKATSGIIIANGALNTTVGSNPPALALPSNYALTWYSGTATISTRIFADSSAKQWISANGVNIQGTNTTDNAPGGFVGEYLTTGNITGIAMSSGSSQTVASASFSPGDWEISGMVAVTPSATTNLFQIAGLASFTSNSLLPIEAGAIVNIEGSLGTTGQNQQISIIQCRASLAATTTMYLVEFLSFTGGTTVTGGGILRGRRVR